MVRIALLGDVHLALSKNTEFERNRFLQLITQLSIKKYDIVIFLGDLFNNPRPTLEEIQLLQFSISKLNQVGIRTIVIDGNHEAVTKSSSTYDYLKIEGLEYLPYNRLDVEDVSIQTLGYSNLDKYVVTNKSDILLSHFRSNFGIIKEEISTKDVSKKANTVILGDIHQKYSPLPNVHYTGSPYSIHFTREPHDYGYIELNIDSGTYKFDHVVLNLPSKRIAVASSTSVSDIEKCIQNPEDLIRIRVHGSSKELEQLPTIPNVTYVTSLILQEQESNVKNYTSTDILETLILAVGDTKVSRNILTNIYKEIT